jgi:hypothetical protein
MSIARPLANRSSRALVRAHLHTSLALSVVAALAAACSPQAAPDHRSIPTGLSGTSAIIAAGNPALPIGAMGAAGTGAGPLVNTAGVSAPAGRSGLVTAGVPAVNGGGAGVAAGAIAQGAAGAISTAPPGSCGMSAERVRVTEIDVGGKVLQGDTDQTFYMLAISPIPSGGSRLAWLSGDNQVHIAQLNAADQLMGAPIALPGHDFSDIYADDKGGVVLLTRDAQGGGTLNCGTISNLCGNSASYPTTYACYDMYMVRFDGSAETWATKLTDSSATRPPYGTSPTDSNRTTFIWSWYGHHGRIAYDGSHWAGYYGASLSGSSQTLTRANCAQSDSTLMVGIDIHQGDQMRVLDASGAIQMASGFDWGCSHSYYERIVYDASAKKFVPICETDASNQLLIAPPAYTGSKAIYTIDMQREIGNYSDIGNVVVGTQGGYWITVSKSRASAAGMADVHLLHFTTGAPDKDLIISNDSMLNCRSNHLAKYGSSRLLAAWETASAANDFSSFTTGRKFYVQTYSAATGEAEGGPYQVDVNGNRYNEFRDYPDGSVAYPTLGSASTKIKIMRILPCP